MKYDVNLFTYEVIKANLAYPSPPCWVRTEVPEETIEKIKKLRSEIDQEWLQALDRFATVEGSSGTTIELKKGDDTK